MEIKADFENILWTKYEGDEADTGEMMYTCVIGKDVSITKPKTEIVKLTSRNHHYGNYGFVKSALFDGACIKYFPRGLRKFFPNLTDLHISGCGLKEISREDLKGLENLKVISIIDNKIKSLPSNLFVKMRNLKRICFRDNKLEFLSSEILEPIEANVLEMVDFRNNTSIDVIYESSECLEKCVASLQELKDIIDENCKTPIGKNETFKNDFFGKFKELWSTGRYSDFTIACGGGSTREFKVHKCVLGTQSSVFEAVFEHDMKEKQTGKMIIEDFRADVVEGMLEFMYTGKVQEGIEMVLYAIANKYNVAELKSVTEKIILTHLDESSAFIILEFGNLYNSRKMKRAAFKVIKEMMPNTPLHEDMMNQPEKLKKIFDIVRECKRKVEDAHQEYRAKMQKLI